MRVVFPEPQSPKMPTANRGPLWRMMPANALAYSSNRSAGRSAGSSRRIR